MSFDRTNPTHLAELKAEVQTDPVTMGYDVNNIHDIRNKINTPSSNVGNDNRTDAEFTGDDLLASIAVNPSEYAVVVSAHTQSAIRTTFVEALIARQDGLIPKRFHATILAIFTAANASTIRTAMIAHATSPISRAEVLWGNDTQISKQDWYAARDS